MVCIIVLLVLKSITYKALDSVVGLVFEFIEIIFVIVFGCQESARKCNKSWRCSYICCLSFNFIKCKKK